MSVIAIFILGSIVTAVTATAAVLVGLEEAADPCHSRVEDLTEFEKRLVGRESEERRSAAG